VNFNKNLSLASTAITMSSLYPKKNLASSRTSYTQNNANQVNHFRITNSDYLKKIHQL